MCDIPAASPSNWGRASRTGRSGPTSSTISPTGAATTRRPAPRSGARPTARSSGFVCAVGTGGTLSGTGIALKEHNKQDQGVPWLICMGSGIYSWYARHEFQPRGAARSPRASGNNRETKSLEGFTPDGQYQITDEEMLPVLFALAAGGGADRRRVERDQCLRRDPPRQGAGAGAHDRDDPRRIPARAISRSCSTRQFLQGEIATDAKSGWTAKAAARYPPSRMIDKAGENPAGSHRGLHLPVGHAVRIDLPRRNERRPAR